MFPTRTNAPGGMPQKPTRDERTVFIGDLPFLCDEGLMYELFHDFGNIEAIVLKKGDGKNHIGYGFITYSTVEEAARAQMTMHGQNILGRKIRVGWATNRKNPEANSKVAVVHPGLEVPKVTATSTQESSVQVHVRFTCPINHPPVTESMLIDLFQPYGNVIDSSIKKQVVRTQEGTLAGYGFVHFAETVEGMQSAQAAIQQMNRTTVDGVRYETDETHRLKMLSLRYKHTGSLAPPPSASPVPAVMSYPSAPGRPFLGAQPLMPGQPMMMAANPTSPVMHMSTYPSHFAPRPSMGYPPSDPSGVPPGGLFPAAPFQYPSQQLQQQPYPPPGLMGGGNDGRTASYHQPPPAAPYQSLK